MMAVIGTRTSTCWCCGTTTEWCGCCGPTCGCRLRFGSLCCECKANALTAEAQTAPNLQQYQRRPDGALPPEWIRACYACGEPNVTVKVSGIGATFVVGSCYRADCVTAASDHVRRLDDHAAREALARYTP